MNDLPTTPNPVPQSGVSGNVNKEVEGAGGDVSFHPAGQEVELSPEVASAGVKVQPTSIPIPPSVSQMGVKAAGQNVAPSPAPVVLPLTDDQIAQGLKEGIWSSWRWLAQWCVRRLKQVHMGLKTIHGHLTRVRE